MGRRPKQVDGLFYCHGQGIEPHYVAKELMAKNKSKSFGIGNICLECGGRYNRYNPSAVVYGQMVSRSKKRKHSPPEITKDEFIKRHKTELVYDAGWRKIQMTTEPGHWNTSSPDRFDDSKGYETSNWRFRPACLNTRFSFSDREISLLPEFKSLPVNVIQVEKDIAESMTSPSAKREDGSTRQVHGLLVSISGNIQTKMRGRHEKKLGDTTQMRKREIMEYIRGLARAQHYRCAYTGVPLIFKRKGGPMQASVERKNTRYTYMTLGNDCLICVGLQSSQTGQMNKRMSDEERQTAADKARSQTIYFHFD